MDLTERIPISTRASEAKYPFHFKGRTSGYALSREPHETRAISAYCSAVRPLVEYIDVTKQSFGIRVRTSAYETELEAWVLPAAESSLSEEEAKEIEIQLTGRALINVFRDVRSDAEFIASMIDEAIREIREETHV
jgi:hypothetical protein